MHKLLKNKLVVFLLLALGLYAAWNFIYTYLIADHTSLDYYVSMNLAFLSDKFLQSLGYSSSYREMGDWIIVTVEGSISPGVRIGTSCNGMSLFGLFTSIIIAFPSKNRKFKKINLNKLWYIPLGILLIHLVNAIRIAILDIIATYNFEWLNFNHDVTFKIVTYTFIFILWYVWINKYSGLNLKTKKDEPKA